MKNKTPGGGLSPAPNAAARMQELLREPAEDAAHLPNEETEVYSNTQVSKSVSGEPGGRLLAPVPAPSRKKVTPSSQIQESTPAASHSLHERVKERLGGKEGKEATVRLSIDVSETMHERIKIYCAANRIPTTRALVITLLDDLLDEAGY